MKIKRSLEEEKARKSKESVVSPPFDSYPGDSDVFDKTNDFREKEQQNGIYGSHSFHGDLITACSKENVVIHEENNVSDLVDKERGFTEKKTETEKQALENASVMTELKHVPLLEKIKSFTDEGVSVKRLSQSDSKYICHFRNELENWTVGTSLSDTVLLKKRFLEVWKRHDKGM